MTLDPLCCKVASAFPTGNRWNGPHSSWCAYWSLCSWKHLGLRAAGHSYCKLYVCVVLGTRPSL